MKSNDLKPNHRILIVDDNPSIHSDFRDILCAPKSDNSASAKLEAALFDEDTSEPLQVNFELDSAFQGQEGGMIFHKRRVWDGTIRTKGPRPIGETGFDR